MKFEKKEGWIRKFAWLPRMMTTGAHDAGSVIWLERYYETIEHNRGQSYKARISQSDRKYSQDRIFNTWSTLD